MWTPDHNDHICSFFLLQIYLVHLRSFNKSCSFRKLSTGFWSVDVEICLHSTFDPPCLHEALFLSRWSNVEPLTSSERETL